MFFKQDNHHGSIDIVLILTKGFRKIVCEFSISTLQRYVRQLSYRNCYVSTTLWQLGCHLQNSWMCASVALPKLEIQVEKDIIILQDILGKKQAKISYSNYNYVENIKIPFSLVISAENKEINLDYTQVSFLDKLKIKKFKIPKGYEKL